MAKPETSGFSNEQVSLKTLAASPKHKFPIIVKTCGRRGTSQRQKPETNLPPEATMLIEGPVVLPYAVVRILDFHDEQKVMSEKGGDFVLEHTNFLGQDFLMPLCFDKKLKIVQHPKRRGRYGTIAELIDDLPRYVRVEQDTVSIPPPDCVRQPINRLVPANTKLELKWVQETDYENNDDKFVECYDENSMVYFFKETSRVNFTSVPDIKLHTLEEIVHSMLLPKVAMFQEVSANDVIAYDDVLAHSVLVLASGPVEVTRCEKRTMLACWIREGSSSCCNVLVLVPERLWADITVQSRAQASMQQHHAFITKNFPCYMSHGLGILKNNLYMIPIQDRGITRLLPKTTVCADDSDSSGSDYERPMVVQQNPPLPPRTSKSTDAIDTSPENPNLPIPLAKTNSGWQKIVQIVKDRAESGFNKVHAELVSVVRRKSQSKKPKPKIKPKPKPRMKSISEIDNSEIPPSSPASPVLNANKPLPKRSISEPGQNEVAPSSPVTRSVKNANRSLPKRSMSDCGHSETAPLSPAWSALNAKRPLPKPPSNADDNINQQNAPIEEQLELHEYDYVVTPTDRMPPYVKFDNENLNESERTFYGYTMSELAECFSTRGLKKLGELCRKEKLDGPFFRGVDWKDLLTQEPFCLSSLDVKKVEIIIKRGWIPK